MPKRDPNLPGDIVFTPVSWQVALAQLFVELTALVKAARIALEEQEKRR
jgi:hypothetical protein